jgi:DNA-binding IclR family transcriptional regulator
LGDNALPSQLTGNKTIEKALKVLDAFSIAQQKLGIQQLETITDLPRATLYRIINPLLKNKYLQFDKATEKYFLGIKIYERAGIVKRGFELTKVLPYHLDRAKEDVKHTITVGVLRAESIIQIDMRESAEGLKIGTYIGKISQPTHGLLGKVLLAYQPKDKSQELLAKYPPPKWNGKADYSPDDIIATYEAVLENGYATSFNDLYEEVSGLAFPIFNHRNDCIAAVAILLPTVKFTADEKSRCIRLGKRLAKNISHDMGHTEQPRA